MRGNPSNLDRQFIDYSSYDDDDNGINKSSDNNIMIGSHIKLNRLGRDQIYINAKHYNNKSIKTKFPNASIILTHNNGVFINMGSSKNEKVEDKKTKNTYVNIVDKFKEYDELLEEHEELKKRFNELYNMFYYSIAGPGYSEANDDYKDKNKNY